MAERLKTESQHMLIKRLLVDAYSINYTKAYVSGKKESIVVEKGTAYKGVIPLFHNNEGSFFGMIKSYDPILTIETDVFFLEGRESLEFPIQFTIDTQDLVVGHVYHCRIGIIYLGGEIDIPLHITVAEKKSFEKPVLTQMEQDFYIESNQICYRMNEKGYFSYNGKHNQDITLKIIGKDKGIIFDQDTYHFQGSGQVAFDLDITQEDIRRGLIPVNSHPEHPLKVLFQIQNEDEKMVLESSIKITSLKKINHMGALDDQGLMRQRREILLKQFEEEMVTSIIFDYKSHKNDALRQILMLLEVLISDDIANINLRLFYISIAIDLELYHVALEEINQIDRYILFYDQNSPDISDILMCLMALLKQDRNVQRMVSRWKVDDGGNWVKIILKNKIIANRYKEYDEYKMLYDMGVRHVFLLAEALAYINKNGYLPSGEDDFYKELITFGAMRGAISSRLLRKIENSAYYLIKNRSIASEAAYTLYQNNTHSKQLLLLLALAYIEEEDLSLKACEVYQLCLEEQITVKDLLEYYIRGCYHNKKLLDLNYFRHAFDIEVFEEPCQKFIWLNLVIFKEQFPVLTNYYYRKYVTPPRFSAEDIILPDDEALAESFLRSLVENHKGPILAELYEKGIFSRLSLEERLVVVLKIATENMKSAIPYATELMKAHIYNDQSLLLIATDFRGNTEEMTFLAEKLLESDIQHIEFYQAYLLRCVLTRQHTDLLEQIFLRCYQVFVHPEFRLLILRYLSASVIIEEYEVVSPILELMMNEMAVYNDIGIEIAALKMCASLPHYMTLYGDQIRSTLERHIHLGVIFSFYGQLLKNKELEHNLKAQQYFTYYTKSINQVNFCYRLDEEKTFIKIPMNHIAFGLFLVKVVMFYGEYIQYYIEEVNTTEQDIKLSDLFVKEEVIEIQDEDNIFDIINTIEISKALNDEESLEKAIESYLRIGDNKPSKLFLL